MTTGTRIALLLVGLVALTTVGVGPSVAVSEEPGGTTAPVDCSFPVEHTDASGETVAVDAEPETVVALGPSAAQTMWEIGAEAKVIGVPEHASYLDGAASRTNVSGAGQTFVDVETVVDLDPDLVLAPNIIPSETVETLRNNGLTVYRFEQATSLAAVEEKTRLTGALVGACESADDRAAEMNRSLATVGEAVDAADRPGVLYVMGGGYTPGEGTFIDSIIEAAGGTNVAARAGIDGYAEISEETVVEQDPAWIFTNSDIGTLPASAGYEKTTAVEEGQVFVADADTLSQPAPRTVQVVERVAATLHPDRYDGAAAYDRLDLRTPTTTATTPGMGVPVALLAVALLALSKRE